MSIFGSVIKLVTTLVTTLGPLLPGLLGILKVKMNDEDIDGIHWVTARLRVVANRLNSISDKADLAVEEFSEGGTAITGNEGVALAAEIKAAIEEFGALNDEL